MKDLIKAHLEPTVEENLQRTVKELKDPNRKGLKVGAWVFNDHYGTYVYENNDPVPTPNNFNEEEISHFHAERLCISSLPREFKQKGTNTLFVTLIPCIHCIRFLKKQNLNLQVIYFVDPVKKENKERYKKIAMGLPMTKYVNKGSSQKDERINNLINKLAKLTHWYVER